MSDIVESDPYALPPENLSAIHPYAISATAPVPCVDILPPPLPQKALTEDRDARRVVRQ